MVAGGGTDIRAGLGVVELTIALHYVFDTPKDKLVWDVSHQCYPHKLITGRRDKIKTLRKGGGLSGFTNIFFLPYFLFFLFEVLRTWWFLGIKLR